MLTDATSDDMLSVAYPGTACVSGWTTACETTLEVSGTAYTQTWCCPDSGWSCTMEAGFLWEPSSLRRCVSTITTPTNVYYQTDETTSLSWINSESAVTLYHDIFALQALATSTEGTTMTKLPTATRNADGTTMSELTTTTRSADGSSNTERGLGAGVIVGIVLGMLILLGGLVAGIWFYRRSKNRAAAVKKMEDSSEGVSGTPGTAELQGVQNIPNQELDGYSRAELDAAGQQLLAKPSEMNGEFGRYELP